MYTSTLVCTGWMCNNQCSWTMQALPHLIAPTSRPNLVAMAILHLFSPFIYIHTVPSLILNHTIHAWQPLTMSNQWFVYYHLSPSNSSAGTARHTSATGSEWQLEISRWCSLCTANLELLLQWFSLLLYLSLHTSHELKVEMTQVPQFLFQFGATCNWNEDINQHAVGHMHVQYTVHLHPDWHGEPLRYAGGCITLCMYA